MSTKVATISKEGEVMSGPPDNYELDKRISLLEQTIKTIERELHDISGNLMKLVWVVVTAVVIGLINLWVRFGATGM